MIAISISLVIAAVVLASAWIAVTRIKEEENTKRVKLDIEGEQVNKYNQFLEPINEHMISNSLAKRFKIITVENENN